MIIKAWPSYPLHGSNLLYSMSNRTQKRSELILVLSWATILRSTVQYGCTVQVQVRSRLNARKNDSQEFALTAQC
jgi:hypothetical protein